MIYFITGQPRMFASSFINPSTMDELLQWLEPLDEVEVDTETWGFFNFENNVRTIQLGNNQDQFVIDVESLPKREVFKLKPFFKDSATQKLFQNAKFDLKFLKRYGFDVRNVYDTLLAELVILGGRGESDDGKFIGGRELSLKDLAWKYCNVELDKSIRGDINRLGLVESVIKYAADDVKWLGMIKAKQVPIIEEMDMLNVLELENKVVHVFAEEIEYNGMRVNVPLWTTVAEATGKATQQHSDELDRIVMNEPKLAKYVPKYVQGNMFAPVRQLNINWGSAAQLLPILNSLELKEVVGKTKKPIVFDDTNERSVLRHSAKHPLIKEILAFKKQKKLSNAFGMKFLNHINKNTGRVHPDIWQIVSTGRISCKDPNLLQIPSRGPQAKIIRSAFIPKDGNVIVGGDYSAMELRIIAHYSQDPVWLDAFRTGKDLHAVLAAATFNIPIEDVKKDTPFKAGVTYREVQKTINFGLAFGMSEYKLADTMTISVPEAKAIIDKFFSVAPKVKKFLDSLGYTGIKRGYICSAKPYSRRRYYDGWDEKMALSYLDNKWSVPKDIRSLMGSVERRSKNMPIQGTNGDVIKAALIKLYDLKRSIPMFKDVLIIASVYDEIVCEAPKEVAEEWKNLQQDVMVAIAERQITSVPVKVDVKITPHWEK